MILKLFRNFIWMLLCLFVLALPGVLHAQNSGTISGTVTDPTGAVVPKATVEIHNPVSGYNRTVTTDTAGNFSFSNVPFNPYHVEVTATGFNTYSQDVDLRSAVAENLKIPLSLAGAASMVTVEASGARDLVETEPDLSHRRGPRPFSTSFHSKVRRPRSALLLRWRLPASQRIRTAC